MTNDSSKHWHAAQWGLLGWIETGLKEIAIVTGVLAFFATRDLPVVPLAGHPRPVLLLLLGAMTLGMLFVQLPFRIYQREIVSVVFAATMALGHAALFVALLRQPDLRAFGFVFAIFQVLGDLVKHRYLVVTGYTEGPLDTAMMTRGVRGVIAAYLALAVLFLL